MVWVRMFWYSIQYEWVPNVVPHFYCNSPVHAQNPKKCLRVGQPFLQLRAKFQDYISSQKVFRDTCVRAVDSWHTGFSQTGYMGKNTENEFYVIISLQVVGFSQNSVGMFYSMIPMQCPSQNSKFENFGHFMGGIRSLYQWGGVVPHFRTPRQGGPKIRFQKFFRQKVGERKKTHTCKRFFRNSLKIAQNSIFPKTINASVNAPISSNLWFHYYILPVQQLHSGWIQALG